MCYGMHIYTHIFDKYIPSLIYMYRHILYILNVYAVHIHVSNICIYVYKYLNIDAYNILYKIYACVDIYVYMCVYIYLCVHMYVYISVYTHTHKVLL